MKSATLSSRQSLQFELISARPKKKTFFVPLLENYLRKIPLLRSKRFSTNVIRGVLGRALEVKSVY